jgi:hypothetical protein
MSAPLAEFDLRGGTRLKLYSNRLVHDGPGTLEIFPYGHLASVRVAFERDPRKLNWAIGLAIAAILLAAVSGPLQRWLTGVVASPGDGTYREMLTAILNALIAFANLLPKIALFLGVLAAALIALFVLGRTTFTLAFAATERAFGTFGRNRRLIEFAEILGERLAERGK